eukprot:2249913-Rhodomonas_salina.1
MEFHQTVVHRKAELLHRGVQRKRCRWRHSFHNLRRITTVEGIGVLQEHVCLIVHFPPVPGRGPIHEFQRLAF